MKKNDRIIAFDIDENSPDWQIINDSVMGGLSVAKARKIEGSIIFSGNVSTANNGGFTSVYRKISKLDKDVTAVRIRIKGDGNRYQLRMRSELMDKPIAYKIEFVTAADRLENFNFNLLDFTASFRGRIINNAPALKAEFISDIGFLIAAKQETEFKLETYAIEFY